MKFYNREKEIGLIKVLSKAPGTTFIIVKGLRRIGKTRLILESLQGEKFINLFIPKDKNAALFLEEANRELQVPGFSRVIDLLRYLFEKHKIIFIDEFQNFYDMDKSIYSDIQKLFEEQKSKGMKNCLIVTGSSYSLIQKIFFDYAKALYGRKDLEIVLDELKPLVIIKLLRDLGIEKLEEQIKFWSVFGGFPKFYELLEKVQQKTFEAFMKIWYSQSKSLIEEGNTILVSEFGGAYKTYYSLLEAIAQGKTKLSEIASIFDNNPLLANRYLDVIRKEYNLVVKNTPLTADIKKSRQGNYQLRNNFIRFWFSFIKRYEGYYEQNRFSELEEKFDREINAFIGKGFEDFCRELLREKALPRLSFKAIGRQWGTILTASKERNQYEIDICGVNEESKEILFGECKWQEKVDASRVLSELKQKAGYVDWHKGKRKEHYVLFAKSFKQKIKEKNVSLFDLKGLSEILQKR